MILIELRDSWLFGSVAMLTCPPMTRSISRPAYILTVVGVLRRWRGEGTGVTDFYKYDFVVNSDNVTQLDSELY